MRLLLIGLIFLTGCSANWHVRQARKHLDKAKTIDPTVVVSDTITVSRDTIITFPEIKLDTAVYEANPTDTTSVDIPLASNSKVNAKIKTFFDPATNKRHIEVNIPAQKDTIKVHDKIIKEIAIERKKTPLSYYVGVGIVGVILLIIIGSVLRRLLK